MKPLPRFLREQVLGRWCLGLAACVIALVGTAAESSLATLDEALVSPLDRWGEAAMAKPNGASYEFFAPLLPPPRYVNADFHYYPIVLSAPEAKTKARLIANGSGVNLRGGARSWNDNGTPFTFRVGPDEFIFGSVRERLSEPTLAEGWLPIVEIRYQHASPFQSEGAVPLVSGGAARLPEIYRLEAFASVDPTLVDYGVVFVRFSLAQGTNGTVTVTTDSLPGLGLSGGKLSRDQGEVLAGFDAAWKWERQRAVGRLTAKNALVLAIATKPLPRELSLPLDYDGQRRACVDTWRSRLEPGMNVETPEPIVNHAWRHLLVENFALMNGNRMHYSAGNQYDRLYEAEGSDAALAMMSWGFAPDMRRLIEPLLDFTRAGLEFHQSAFKILDVCRYYWQTRDAAAVRALRPRWEKEMRRIIEQRTGPHGLFPPERYAGDISTPAQTVNANAHAWRALRDLGAVLAEIGETAEAERCTAAARAFRPVVLAAIEASMRRETSPPFIPVALHSQEAPHDPIVRSRIGSYWNIVIGYTVGSGIFSPGTEAENWIPRYQEQHGGLFLGMLRAGGDEFNFWTGEHRVNPLYGTRYAIDALRRDDPERALVSFYGMLAQGFTRNTFISAEGASIRPLDDGGRIFYCPPNSAANGHFLSLLRHLLVQDFDQDDDGRPDTLRLLFATPRRWLEDGKRIRVERAPTAFGEVSLNVESRLAAGAVVAVVTLPERSRPIRTLLRIRVPDGWRVRGATAGEIALPTDAHGTVDLTALRGRVTLQFTVTKD